MDFQDFWQKTEDEKVAKHFLVQQAIKASFSSLC
jgi:hypothetical protein